MKGNLMMILVGVSRQRVRIHTLKQVLTTGMIFNYEYDFGSTTEIMVKVLDHYSAQKQNEKVVILSRNNPPEFACSICGNSRSLKRERFFH